MGRLLQATVLVTSMVGVASAKPSRKVRVESSPPGATVYIESIDNGEACSATPCTIDAPLGEVTLIIRLEGYGPEFSQLQVTRGTKPLKVAVDLKAAVGTLRIIGAPKGATIKIDNADKGKVLSSPYELELPAGPAGVQIIVGGKTIATDVVDVPMNDAVEISVKGGGTAVASGGGDDDDDDGDDSGDDDGGDAEETSGPRDEGGGDETPAAPAALRPRILEAGLALDFAFRSFRFSDGTAPFDNSGEVLVGPAIELWPGRAAGVRVLRNLSLFARVQFAITHQRVTRMGSTSDVGAETLWGGIEISLRHAWRFGKLGVQASAGWVRDQVQFNADSAAALAMVPSADYRSLRIGARLSYALGRVEPYVTAENRFVMSGGDLANRGDSADTSGYRVGLGAQAPVGPVGVRAEFSRGSYSWTYSGTGPSGATDTITYLSFLVGYDY